MVEIISLLVLIAAAIPILLLGGGIGCAVRSGVGSLSSVITGGHWVFVGISHLSTLTNILNSLKLHVLSEKNYPGK